MELRHLDAFLALAEERHFGRAARRVHVAQSGLSRRIADLERRVGVVLFERGRGSVRLTPAGEQFAVDVARLMAELDAAVARARRAGPGLTGRVSVATTELGIRNGLVAAAVQRFRAAHLAADVAVHLEGSLAQAEGLRAQRYDVGLVLTPPRGSDLLVEPLLDDPLETALLPPAHRLGEAGAVRLADLRRLPLLLFPRAANPLFHERLAAEFSRAGFAPSHVHEISEGAASYAMVAAGFGWSLQPRSYLSAPPPGTAACTIEDFSLPLTLSLAWRRGDRSAPLQAFLDEVRSAARHLGQAEQPAVYS